MASKQNEADDWQDLAPEANDWEDIASEEPYSPLATFGAKALDTAALGYYPEIAGRVQSLLTDKDYVAARDEAARRLEAGSEESPIISGLGTGTGIVGSMLLPGAPLIKGLQTGTAAARLGRAGVGLAEAGAMAGLQNPGSVPGEVDPLQLDQRAAQLQDAAQSPLTYVAGAIPGIISPRSADPVTKALPKEKRAVERFKPSLKQVQEMREAQPFSTRGQKNLGKFIIDNKIAGWTDSYSDMARKAKKIEDDFGKELGEVYKKNENTINKAVQSGKADPDIAKRAEQFGSIEFYKDIISQFDQVNAGSPDATQAREFLTKVLQDEFVSRNAVIVDVPTSTGKVKQMLAGVEQPSLMELHSYRKKIDGAINDFSRNFADPDQSAKDKALKFLRNQIEDAINTEIKIAEKYFSPGEFKRFKELNDNFSKATQVSNMVAKRAAMADMGSSSFKDLMSNLNPLPAGGQVALGEGARTGITSGAAKLSRPLSIMRQDKISPKEEDYIFIAPEDKMITLEEISKDESMSASEKAKKYNSVKKYNKLPF